MKERSRRLAHDRGRVVDVADGATLRSRHQDVITGCPISFVQVCLTGSALHTERKQKLHFSVRYRSMDRFLKNRIGFFVVDTMT